MLFPPEIISDDNTNEGNKKKKLMGMNEIINIIKWDPKYNKEEFTIVYEDRFEGDIEIPFD